MPQATSKPKTVEFKHLTTPAELGLALEVALAVGYRGTLAAYPQHGAAVWTLELNGPPGVAPVTATLGDVLVWHTDTRFLEAMTEDQFHQVYERHD